VEKPLGARAFKSGGDVVGDGQGGAVELAAESRGQRGVWKLQEVEHR
jgi:hypothetical protein